jgi:hypothetical protein
MKKIELVRLYHISFREVAQESGGQRTLAAAVSTVRKIW